ncbi:MAG: hypothetical protein Crog4KO_06720 [Crocinitomicaceae bacterium]
MIKRLVHSVTVLKPGAKLQLRIELPSDIKRITGVLPLINSRLYTGHTNQPEPRQPFEGSLWLRVTDKRDVFYAENVTESFKDIGTIARFPKNGFLNNDLTWTLGQRPTPLSIEVPINQTIIEGYFEDTSNNYMKGYTLEIYLNAEL